MKALQTLSRAGGVRQSLLKSAVPGVEKCESLEIHRNAVGASSANIELVGEIKVAGEPLAVMLTKWLGLAVADL